MNQIPQRKFWPYDELIALREGASSKFTLATPWLKFQFDVNANDISRAEQITKKISDKTIAASDLEDLNWLLSSFASYPFAYILPRPHIFGSDLHDIFGKTLNLNSPTETLAHITENSEHQQATRLVSLKSLATEWTWDAEASLAFSQAEGGYDPESLFSIARRFHLLNDLENNQTAQMFEHMKTLSKGSSEFKKASALVMRQNHYITEKCEQVLSAALPLAQNATEAIEEFMQAESGHDKILEKALSNLGTDAKEVKVMDSTLVLMELFHLIAKKNLLAFSMVVDIFERTSYLEEDPFAKILIDGGEAAAASKIETHREINNSGGHENVAIGFLAYMKPVTADYATEALKLAELLTQVIHLISKETIEQFKK
ncbi:MAG: hypothetical protein ABL930_04870 [Pseudobdellovibrio sp.]